MSDTLSDTVLFCANILVNFLTPGECVHVAAVHISDHWFTGVYVHSQSQADRSSYFSSAYCGNRSSAIWFVQWFHVSMYLFHGLLIK